MVSAMWKYYEFNVAVGNAGAANDWLERRDGWEGRIGANVMFTCSHDEARANSRTRHAALASWEAPFVGTFDWVTEPVLNQYTRIGVEMSAASGILRVMGYESVPGFELPQPVTQMCEIGAPARVAVAAG